MNDEMEDVEGAYDGNEDDDAEEQVTSCEPAGASGWQGSSPVSVLSISGTLNFLHASRCDTKKFQKAAFMQVDAMQVVPSLRPSGHHSSST